MHLLLALPALAALASAHGLVQKPPARAPGDATAAACGKAMVTFYKQDNTSYPEALLRSSPRPEGYDAKKCNLWLCKGYQFADNKANVQTYKTGDTVDFDVWIRIPHSGNANVSVVDTTSNTLLSAPLIAWASGYAATNRPPADQTRFTVKIPELGGKCVEPGVCALQWHWFGQGQTYQSCVDFVVPAVAAAADPGHGGHKIRGQTWY